MKLTAGFASFLVLGVVACGGAKNGGFAADDGGAPASDGGDVGSDANMIVGSNDGGMVTTGPAEVYGHSPDTLYKLDPDTKAVTVVGVFSGCTGDQVIDIALDANSIMYATTQNPGALYRVDRNTAVCTHIADGAYPNSLSFVPKGTLDPGVEALVGYVGSTYVRINTATGAMNDVGAIGNGYSSSGDIVSVIGGGTYLTVTGTGCNSTDCILEVNPTTGAMMKKLGDIKHGSVFGLAFWAGAAYGFDSAGELFQINFTSSGSVTTAPITIPGKPAGLKFWGAGSTTSAPPTAAK